MEEARRKLRICLAVVVMAAVIAGCIYYFGEIQGSGHVDEGTLVWNQAERDVYGG